MILENPLFLNPLAYAAQGLLNHLSCLISAVRRLILRHFVRIGGAIDQDRSVRRLIICPGGRGADLVVPRRDAGDVDPATGPMLHGARDLPAGCGGTAPGNNDFAALNRGQGRWCCGPKRACVPHVPRQTHGNAGAARYKTVVGNGRPDLQKVIVCQGVGHGIPVACGQEAESRVRIASRPALTVCQSTRPVVCALWASISRIRLASRIGVRG